MRDLTQKEYDKLIAVASSMKLALKFQKVHSIMIDICHGEDAGKIEMMTLDEIDKFLDTVFEYEVDWM